MSDENDEYIPILRGQDVERYMMLDEHLQSQGGLVRVCDFRFNPPEKIANSDECWVPKKRRTKFRVDGKLYSISAASFMLYVTRGIADSRTPSRTCHTPGCCNPNHLVSPVETDAERKRKNIDSAKRRVDKWVESTIETLEHMPTEVQERIRDSLSDIAAE